MDKKILVDLAKEGDSEALEALIVSIRDKIYNLALKMLYEPSDADDATQEILIKVVTRLDGFRQLSSFDTWAYAIASNHLLNKRKSLTRHQFTFSSCEEMIAEDVVDETTVRSFKGEQDLVIEEMRISCMQGLLQCLDWDHRIAFILGETMDISGNEGAQILGITPGAFRKRLSRSRKRLRDFLLRNCALYHDANPCKCSDQALLAVNHGLLDPDHLQFASPFPDSGEKKQYTDRWQELEGLSREASLMRYHVTYQAPETFVEKIRSMLDSGRFSSLKNIN